MPVRPSAGQPRLLALAALVVGAVAIASSPILVRLSELPPTATAFYRVAIAAPALYFMVAFGPQEGRTGGSAAVAPALFSSGLVLAGLALAADLVCLHWSLRYTSVANAMLLLNLAPVFVVVLAWAIYGEPVTRRFLASLALAGLGLAVLLGGPGLDRTGTRIGDALGLAAGAFYGVYLLAIGRARRRQGTSAIMAASTATCAVALLPVVLAMGESLVPRTLDGIAVLLALALVTHVGGQGLVAFALRDLPASSSAATLLLQPVAAAAGAWMVFGEHLSAVQLAGGAVVLVGVALCNQAVLMTRSRS